VDKWETKWQDFILTHGDDPTSGKLIFFKLHVFVFKINSHCSLNISLLYLISLYATYFSCIHFNIWFSWKLWRLILQMYRT
jgi:hypothetical protein